jgi:hypothetical protein
MEQDTGAHLGSGEGHSLSVEVKKTAEVDEETLGSLRAQVPNRRALGADVSLCDQNNNARKQ